VNRVNRSEQIAALDDEVRRLRRHDQPTNVQRARLGEAEQELRALRVAEVTDLVRTGQARTERGVPFDDYPPVDVRDRSIGPPRSETRGRALDTVERIDRDGVVPHDGLEFATRAIDNDPTDAVARWALAAGDPAYARAFRKLIIDPQTGGHLLDEEERAALWRAKSEVRAMSLTDSAGGYLVPFQLDPSIIITSAGSVNPIRQIARRVVATGDIWSGVTSAGVTASWDAEGTEVSDDSPTLGQPSIPVHRGTGFVPFSLEVGADAPGFETEMGRLLSDAKDQLEAAAFATGTGSGEPTGIVAALTGTSSVVPSATTDTFAAEDVYSVLEMVPPRFRPNASWIAALPILNLIEQFETSNGSKLFDLSSDRLLRKPVYEASGLDGTITADANNYVAVVGDFANYVVADRLGMVVELVPHLFGSNRRPTGSRGFFAHWRVGADSVNDAAFAMLNVT
jgi:HK97 family phage major capsid protein